MSYRYLLVLVLSMVPLDSSMGVADEPNEAEFDGRSAVVRLYQCETEAPRAFEKTTVRLSGDRIPFDFDSANDNTFIVIFGEDQRDEMVKSALGNCVYGWAYQQGLRFALLQKPAGNGETRVHEQCVRGFVDGTGEPIPAAKVDIYLNSGHKRVLIRSSNLDENGELKGLLCRRNVIAIIEGPSYLDSRSAGFRFRISHPDYGSAFVQPDLFTPYQTFFVPLVPAGSEADNRSIWGQIVDADGQSAAGATIYGIAVITVGGDWIRSVKGQRQGVTTNEAGNFRMYLPASEEAHQIGLMVPPGSKYQVKIEPPAGSNLLPTWPEIMSGQPTEITLQYAGYFHTFAFEDANGLITDPNVLTELRVVVRRSGKYNDVWLRYKQWKDGAWLPLGRYDASHDRYRFKGLDVTADSPEQLVFRVEQAKTYAGRVVNGITGEPMPGAFVVATEQCNGQSSLAWLAAEEWKTLHQLDAEIVFRDNPTQDALRRVDVVFSAKRLLRTDHTGRFEIEVPPTTKIKRIVAFEENYLTFHSPTSRAKQDEDGRYRLGDLKLFPAAKVKVVPAFEVPAEDWPKLGLQVWFLVGPQWFINREKSPAWADRLLAACAGEADEGVFRGYRLAVVKIQGDYRAQRFLVPAGVTLRMNLRTLDNVEWAPITVAEGIKLKQGELLDLGRHEILEPFAVFVEVVNSQGAPVEGVPVVVCGGYDPAISSSDEQGIALFEFVGYSKGEFIVECDADDDPNTPSLRQAIPYQITGPQDANSTYTMTVSDEILGALFK